MDGWSETVRTFIGYHVVVPGVGSVVSSLGVSLLVWREETEDPSCPPHNTPLSNTHCTPPAHSKSGTIRYLVESGGAWTAEEFSAGTVDEGADGTRHRGREGDGQGRRWERSSVAAW